MHNKEEINQFLETYSLKNLNEEDTDNLKAITSSEIETVIQKTP